MSDSARRRSEPPNKSSAGKITTSEDSFGGAASAEWPGGFQEAEPEPPEEWPGEFYPARPGGFMDGLEDAVDGEALRQRLLEALPDPRDEPAVRPALVQLVADQGELAVQLLEGFGDRGELLEWQQEVVIQTLGQLPDGWFPRVAADAPTVSALLGRPWGVADGFAPDRAREIRRGLVANDLLPAFHSALETFRWAAVERLEHLDDQNEGDAPDPVDPRRQQFPAMRPELGQLDDQQSRTLGDLLEGFDSSEELLVWCHQLQGASYAEIPA
ncbi:MAG: hypothetical protein ABEJ00_00030, partial [Gemmatimonadota bacterium]